MPMLCITIDHTRPRLHDRSASLVHALNRELLANPGPVTIMVHGYRYAPGHQKDCPHRTLMAHSPLVSGGRVVSWPERLGMTGHAGEGLGISLGWSARGTLWRAHARAEAAGTALAAVIAQIHQIAPGRAVNVIAHSLGARVALTAVRLGASVKHCILLAAAEYSETARQSLDSPGGSATKVLNVTSRENDLYDFLFERLIAPPIKSDRMMGHGKLSHPRMVTLQLDDPISLDVLRRSGFEIALPDRMICHWSAYLRDGVFPMYRAIIRGDLSLDFLQTHLPSECAPRWSRLRPRLPRPVPDLLPAE